MPSSFLGPIPSIARKAVIPAAALLLLGTGIAFTIRPVDLNNNPVSKITTCPRSHGSGACLTGITMWEVTSSGGQIMRGPLSLSGSSITLSGSSIAVMGADKKSATFLISNGATAATTGTSLFGGWRPDFDGQISDVLLWHNTDGSGVTVDVNIGGTSIFSTRLTSDEREASSTGATTPFVFAASKTFSRNDKITIDLDACGNTALGAACPSGVNVRLSMSGSTFYPR